MEDINRVMHYSQQGYEGMGGLGEQQTSPQSPEEAGGVQDGVRGHASINTILDQIMTITDQSLDEAQVLPLTISTLISIFLMIPAIEIVTTG